ncbi:MAG TPA: archease [Anaeromyxobacteraceae bacterium]|nr:archease [Anaeromyxobacteraceae bacterium]
MRWELPQPFEDLDHTADVGVSVEGASPEEALARLVLAQSALLAGGAPVAAAREQRIAVRGGDRAAVAVECLRELLFVFSTRRELAAWCEVQSLVEDGATLAVGLGHWEPQRHGEGVDLKAVTWHAARFEAHGGGWRAQVVFDI